VNLATGQRDSSFSDTNDYEILNGSDLPICLRPCLCITEHVSSQNTEFLHVCRLCVHGETKLVNSSLILLHNYNIKSTCCLKNNLGLHLLVIDKIGIQLEEGTIRT